MQLCRVQLIQKQTAFAVLQPVVGCTFSLMISFFFMLFFYLYNWTQCICSSSSSLSSSLSSSSLCGSCDFVVLLLLLLLLLVESSFTSNDFKNRVQNKLIGAMVCAWSVVNCKCPVKNEKKTMRKNVILINCRGLCQRDKYIDFPPAQLV